MEQLSSQQNNKNLRGNNPSTKGSGAQDQKAPTASKITSFFKKNTTAGVAVSDQPHQNDVDHKAESQLKQVHDDTLNSPKDVLMNQAI